MISNHINNQEVAAHSLETKREQTVWAHIGECSMSVSDIGAKAFLIMSVSISRNCTRKRCLNSSSVRRIKISSTSVVVGYCPIREVTLTSKSGVWLSTEMTNVSANQYAVARTAVTEYADESSLRSMYCLFMVTRKNAKCN